MEDTNLIDKLNTALSQEHACYIRYKTHAATVSGPYADSVSERLKEIAQDEAGHADNLRDRIAALGGTPTMSVHTDDLIPASTLKEIIEVNVEEERKAIALYTEIINAIHPRKQILLYETIEHIIRDEQEHLEELERLREG